MTYALILAGGTGTRMGRTKMPKQFLDLGEKPIFIHTLEQFMLNDNIDKIILCCHKDWIAYARNTIDKFIKNNDIIIVDGGDYRSDSMINGCNYIKENFGVNKDDIVLTHDAVRPFISQKVINRNIEAAKKYDAIDTVIPATDTIVISKDNKMIDEIPNRSHMYQGQTPQTFNLEKLINIYNKLTKKEIESLTDACKIFTLKNEPVTLVEGEIYNIKITTLYDLKLANSILELRGNR